MNNRSRVIVVRHGERIDEVDSSYWIDYCKQKYNPNYSIEFESRINDPILTEEGCLQAQEVAETLLTELNEYNLEEISYIYSSKLIRSIQTAYYIALKLSKPILVSRGFAMTAAAVEDMGDQFQFLTIEEIQEFCPNVEIIDGDVDPSHPHSVPSPNWWHSINHVINQNSISIIVAHRESIRNLVRRRFKTPYCCYGVFEKDHQKNQIQLAKVSHRTGENIDLS